jgi:hypothetical protein
MRPIVTASSLAGLFLFAAGCGAIDREVDCNKICDKKKECVDNNYNVSACVDSCRSQAKMSSSYGQKVNDCSACVETRACAQVAECYLKDSCPTLP